MEQNQIHTQNSTSEPVKPESEFCSFCFCEVPPYFVEGAEGFGFKPRWVSRGSICQECKDREDKKNADAQRVANERQVLDKAFKAARISPRFKERTFENFKPDTHTKKAFETALSYQPGYGDGLLFFGNCGTGKTHLAASIANKFIPIMPTLFISCPELLLEIRDGFKSKSPIDTLETAKNVALLIIDDIGTEKPSEWVRETLFVLINHRYEHKLPTVLTTNSNMQQLSERLSQRITSRITEMCRMVRVDGNDFRMKIRKEQNKDL